MAVKGTNICNAGEDMRSATSSNPTVSVINSSQYEHHTGPKRLYGTITGPSEACNIWALLQPAPAACCRSPAAAAAHLLLLTCCCSLAAVHLLLFTCCCCCCRRV